MMLLSCRAYFFKMKNTLIFALFGCLQTLTAQPYFSKNYHVSYNDAGWNVVALHDGILLLDISICDGATTCTSLIKTDFNGAIIWEILLDSLRVANGKNILVDTSGIYLSMYNKAAIESQNIRLFKFDHNGNLLNYKRIGSGLDRELPLSMNWYKDNLLLSIDERFGDSTVTHMAFYTTNFDSIKTISFVKDNGGTSSEFHQSLDENLLHLRSINFANGKKVKVIKADIAGNILWEHALDINDTNFATDLALLPDGGSVTHWNKRIDVWSEDTFEVAEYVVKLDLNGNEIWRHYFYNRFDHFIDNLFVTKSGDIVGCGYYYYFESANEPDSSFIGSWIFQLDDDGNLKWQRYILDSRYPSGQFLYAGAEMANKDYVFTGSIGFIGPPEGDNTWLLKTDSMGCLTPGCGDFQTIVPLNEPSGVGTNLRIQPNPASIYTQVDFQIPAPENCRIVLFDLAGHTVLLESINEGVQKHTLSLHSCPNGAYFVCLIENEKTIARTKLVIQR